MIGYISNLMQDEEMKRKEIFKFKICEVLKKNFAIAIEINFVFLMLVFIFCNIKYEVSDDFVMASIISGAYGNKLNPQMIFVNVLWGYLLSPFYKTFPTISWYMIFQLALCFCSFVAVTYMLFERLNKTMALMLSVLFITIFSNDAYILVQFTKTSALAVMSGSILFLWGLFQGNGGRKKEIIFGGILVFAGSLIRFSTIYIAGCFILIILITEFLRKIKKGRKELFCITMSGVLLMSSVLFAYWFNQYTYEKDEQYKYFADYNEARSRVVDIPNYGYDVNAEKYRKLGISENDYKMAVEWDFADDNVFSLEIMKSLGNIIEDYHNSLPIDIRAKWQDIEAREYAKYPVFWACIVLVIMSAIFIKKSWSFLLPTILIAGGYLFYFFVRGRVVYRVEYAVFLCTFLGILYFWENKYCRKQLRATWIYATLAVVFLVHQIPIYIPENTANELMGQEYKEYVDETFFASWDFGSEKYQRSPYSKSGFQALRSEIEKNPQNFYFMDFNSTIQTVYYAYDPFKALPKGFYQNCVYLAGVTTNFPDVNNLLAQKGIASPLKSLAEENVFLIDNLYYENKLEYLREHYYPKAEISLYKSVDGYQIWKIHKNSQEKETFRNKKM